MLTDRQRIIIEQARTWLGTPFAHQGRVKGLGVDCGGLLVCVGREVGVEVADTPAYSMSPDPEIFRSMLADYCYPISKDEMAPGDVVWISFAGEPRHVAFVTDIGLLHAWGRPGKVVEHRIDEVWRRRIKSVHRVKDFAIWK